VNGAYYLPDGCSGYKGFLTYNEKDEIPDSYSGYFLSVTQANPRANPFAILHDRLNIRNEAKSLEQYPPSSEIQPGFNPE